MDYRSSSSRRRAPWFSERSPLEFEREPSGCASDYATFHAENRLDPETPVLITFLTQLYLFCAQICDYVLYVPISLSQSKRVQRHSNLYKLFTGLAIFVLFGVINLGDRIWRFQELEWRWDHNVYNPRHGPPLTDRPQTPEAPAAVEDSSPLNARNLLLSQTAGSQTLEDLVMISSRPNRAYARQWRRDYVLVSRKSTIISRSCFDKAIVLHTIMETQRNLLPVRVPYDAVALLPPDAIVIDLDYDLLQLMPEDKLVAIAGWEQDSTLSNKALSRTDVIFFNLRHRYAAAVSQLWREMVRPDDVTCGAGNDLQLLIQAILSVIEEGEELSSLVLGLSETDRGFVGLPVDLHVIKAIPPTVPSSKSVMLLSNVAETRMTLQTTSDSVCYRYYPKCEVL